MQEELKPCPFCGRKPEIKFFSANEPVTNFDNYYEIHCPVCLREGLRICHSVKSFLNEDSHMIAKENLAYEWNKRVSNVHENMK